MKGNMMRALTMLTVALSLAACAVRQTEVPTPLAKGADNGQIYAWCQKEAVRQSPSAAWTIKGEAFINAFVKTCMLKAGATPVVVVQ